MTTRTVREPAQALAQRLSRLEERVRAMSLRAWPGAIRTGMEDEVESPDDPTAATVVLSVTATAGRWVVIGHTTLNVASVLTYYDLYVELGAVDPTSGETLTGVDYHFPGRSSYLYPFTGHVVTPVTVVGHFVTNDAVIVTLSTSNAAADAYIASDSCLLLIPV